jgi:hypothetical protein
MPIMMKMETLQIPRKIDNEQEMPDPNASQLTVKAKVGGDFEFDDGNGNPITVPSADLLRTIRPKLEAMSTGTEKVVFVDFEPAVPWRDVVMTMDTIRSLATDVNHDEIKVALKVKEDQPGM